MSESFIHRYRYGYRIYRSLQGCCMNQLVEKMCFRYNVRPDGKADTLTLHGACPVLYGTKWGESIFLVLGFLFLSVFSSFVANKWMFLSVLIRFFSHFSCEQVDPGGSPDLEKALPPLKRIAADATAVINLPVIPSDLLRIHTINTVSEEIVHGSNFLPKMLGGYDHLVTISANTGYAYIIIQTESLRINSTKLWDV